MDSMLKELCDLFISNKNNSEGGYAQGSDDFKLVSSYVFACLNKEVDTEGMKEHYHYLTHTKSVYPGFRGISRIPLLCGMCLSDDPKGYLERVTKLQQKLEDCNIKHPILAILMDALKPEEVDIYVDRIHAIYSRLNKKHLLGAHTNQMVSIFFLAMTNREIEDIVSDVNQCFSSVVPLLFYSVLYLEDAYPIAYAKGETKEKCKKAADIKALMKKKKHPIDYRNEAPIVGLLVDLPESAEEIVPLVIEVDDYIKSHKGFHGLFYTNETRRMFSAMLVHRYLTEVHSGSVKMSEEEKRSYAFAMWIALRYIDARIMVD